MRQYIIMIAATLLSVIGMHAQNPTAPNVQKLVVTSSPAYTLLGVQPDNIQRPSTPRDFIGGVQSAIVNGQLQPNFAMEVNPLNWFKKTNSNQFYANDYFYKPSAAIAKNLSLSLATSTSDTVVFGKLNPGLGLAYGIKFTIIPGTVNATVTKAFLGWELEEAKSYFIETLQSIMEQNQAQLSDAQIEARKGEVIKYLYSNEAKDKKNIYLLLENKQAILTALDQLANDYKNKNSFTEQKTKVDADLQTAIKNKNALLTSINATKIPYDREGFTLDIAAGNVNVFQNNQFKQSAYAKTAVWITPSYRMDLATKNDSIQSIDFLGVIRYCWNAAKVDTGNYLDLGAKLQFNRNAWNASFEWVARRATLVPDSVHSHWTNSWLLSFNYTLNQSTTLKFSFGSSFNGNTTTYTSPSQMFAVGGINLGIF